MTNNATKRPLRDWRVLGIHHVAFAHGPESHTRDALEKLLNLSQSHQETGPGFTERMLPVSSDCYIQLLEATDDGVIQRFVSRRGSALHHVAFEVDNLDAALATITKSGAEMIDETPRVGGLGTRIAFLHPSSFDGLLVELVEHEGTP